MSHFSIHQKLRDNANCFKYLIKKSLFLPNPTTRYSETLRCVLITDVLNHRQTDKPSLSINANVSFNNVTRGI